MCSYVLKWSVSQYFFTEERKAALRRVVMALDEADELVSLRADGTGVRSEWPNNRFRK